MPSRSPHAETVPHTTTESRDYTRPPKRTTIPATKRDHRRPTTPQRGELRPKAFSRGSFITRVGGQGNEPREGSTLRRAATLEVGCVAAEALPASTAAVGARDRGLSARSGWTTPLLR